MMQYMILQNVGKIALAWTDVFYVVTKLVSFRTVLACGKLQASARVVSLEKHITFTFMKEKMMLLFTKSQV